MKLLIWGAGQHAAVVEEAAESRHHYEEVYREADPDLEEWDGCQLIFGFGDMLARLKHAENVDPNRFAGWVVQHKTAYNAGYISPGDFLAAGSVVGVNAVIGDHCIINTCASVDHDCVLGDAVHVCPGARLCGRVKVGKGTVIGAGAIVVPGIEIGEYCRIDSGAIVTEKVPNSCRFRRASVYHCLEEIIDGSH